MQGGGGLVKTCRGDRKDTEERCPRKMALAIKQKSNQKCKEGCEQTCFGRNVK